MISKAISAALYSKIFSYTSTQIQNFLKKVIIVNNDFNFKKGNKQLLPYNVWVASFLFFFLNKRENHSVISIYPVKVSRLNYTLLLPSSS